MKDGKALPAAILGLSIGWLVGLSVSEVVGAVIAALLGLVGGIGAGLVSYAKNGESPLALNLWPMALLGLGIAVGATAGVYARGQQFLASSDPVLRGSPVGSGVLYAIDETSCSELQVARRAGPDNLRRTLRVELGKIGVALDNSVKDDAVIDTVVGELCTRD